MLKGLVISPKQPVIYTMNNTIYSYINTINVNKGELIRMTYLLNHFLKRIVVKLLVIKILGGIVIRHRLRKFYKDIGEVMTSPLNLLIILLLITVFTLIKTIQQT